MSSAAGEPSGIHSLLPGQPSEEELPMATIKKICNTCHYGMVCGPESVACHRYPPTITKTEENAVTTYFPVLAPEAWCGEWKASMFVKK